jgi:hypothetical protein
MADTYGRASVPDCLMPREDCGDAPPRDTNDPETYDFAYPAYACFSLKSLSIVFFQDEYCVFEKLDVILPRISEKERLSYFLP